jgi:hypothetical protein
MTEPRLLCPSEVAVLINCSKDTLKRWRVYTAENDELKGPAFVYLSNGQVRYPRDKLNEYIESLPDRR